MYQNEARRTHLLVYAINLMPTTHFAFFLGGAPPTGDNSGPLVGRSEAKQLSQVSWSTHSGC